MTRIMNFTAKPVRKQLRNRPKEKQKRANPHNFFIKSPQYVPYNSIWEDTSFHEKALKWKNFMFVVPISPKRGYTIENDNKTEG